MGKASIILAIGVTVIISFLIIDLNANNNEGIQSTVKFYDDTEARLIANSGIEIYLEKLREDKSLNGYFANNKLANGTYSVNIYGPDSAMRIISVANFDGVTHTAKVNAKRTKINLPGIKAAMYVTADNTNLNLNGNMSITGNDTNIDGSPGPEAALPGVGVDTPSDSANFINNIKDKIYGSITGDGGSPSVQSINDTRDWTELVKDFIFAADITLASGTYGDGTVLGTWDDPKITVCNGNVSLSGDAYGNGILIVNGDLSLSGNFNFNGIVIAYGESKLVTQTVGNAGVYGGTVFVGQSVDIQATGNAKFFYSSQALANAQAKLKSSRFDIEDWWE